MSREDIHESYEPGNVEVVELGLDHNGKTQWFASGREGWEEVGSEGGQLILDKATFAVGTRIELTNVSEE